MQNIPRTQTKNSERIRKTVLLAVLIAIMLLFSFTPIGYLKVGAIEITFMCIPVAVGAILLGPACGALLGAVFGVTSFVQCFGLSAFGTFLFSVQPVYTALVCILPRILCGYLTGLIFRAVAKHDKTKTLCYFAASLATPAHLYIWDEPLNYIDVFSRMQIETLLLEYQPTMLFVEHDAGFCRRIATKTIRLDG